MLQLRAAMFAEGRVVVVVAGIAFRADERARAVVHGARAFAGEADAFQKLGIE